MLKRSDLIVTASSLGHPPFGELVEAAAAGGFAGLSIWPRESFFRARESGVSIPEMRTLLADHGLVVNDVDAMLGWLGPGDPGDGQRGGPSEAELFEAGEALGARYLNVVYLSQEPINIGEAADDFAGLCDRAAQHGLSCTLEFVPFMPVCDAATAWQIVQQADRPEAGILVDSWHCFRGTTTDADLRKIPGERILAVQVNDAPEQASENLVHETLHQRLPPGEGAIDLAGLLRTLDEIRCPAPLCVEVFSDALVQFHSPVELAKMLGDSIRGVLKQR